MKRRFPFRQFHRYPPVYSLRVHWVPLCPSSHRLGAFAISPHPGVHGFPVLRLLCPIRLSMRALAFRWGLPYLLTHSPSQPSRSLPCSTWKTQTERDRWRVPLLAPSALCGSPVFGQRVEQVDLCHLCHRLRWTEVPPRSARLCCLARLADSIDKVCQGQRSTEGLDHASGDAPYRSSAQPPPLAGLSPAHGAFQEHAAHTIEWSMMLSSNGSLGACTPKVLPHSSMPLSRRTERTLEAVSSRPWFGLERAHSPHCSCSRALIRPRCDSSPSTAPPAPDALSSAL